MTFQEYFQQVKARFLGADISAVSDPTRIQINLTGQAAGTFYVEIKGGNLAIEPYEYRDRDVEITISSENFQKLIEGKLDPWPVYLWQAEAQGDLGKALELKKAAEVKRFNRKEGACGEKSPDRHERRRGFQRSGPVVPAGGLRLHGRHAQAL